MSAIDVVRGHYGLLQRHNVPYFSWNDPRLLQHYQEAGPLDPYQSAAVSKYVNDYYDKTGESIPVDHLDQVMNLARAGGQLPVPDVAPKPSSSTGQHISDALEHVINLNGRQALQPGDPRLEAVFRTTGGMVPDHAADAARLWGDAANQYSGFMAPGAVDDMLGRVKGR